MEVRESAAVKLSPKLLWKDFELQIDRHEVGAVIGRGGASITELQRVTECKVRGMADTLATYYCLEGYFLGWNPASR